MKFLDSEYRAIIKLAQERGLVQEELEFIKSKGRVQICFRGIEMSFYRNDESYMDEDFKMISVLSYDIEIRGGKKRVGLSFEEFINQVNSWLGRNANPTL